MNYPLYKFETCNCQIQADDIVKNKNFTITCPNHGTSLLSRICICHECKKVFEVKVNGYMPDLCPEHQKDYHRRRQAAYYRAKISGTLERFHEEWPNKIKIAHIESNTLPGLRPNPKITNPFRAPCKQGPCSFHKQERKIEPCYSCEYATKYADMMNAQNTPATRDGYCETTNYSIVI